LGTAEKIGLCHGLSFDRIRRLAAVQAVGESEWPEEGGVMKWAFTQAVVMETAFRVLLWMKAFQYWVLRTVRTREKHNKHHVALSRGAELLFRCFCWPTKSILDTKALWSRTLELRRERLDRQQQKCGVRVQVITVLFISNAAGLDAKLWFCFSSSRCMRIAGAQYSSGVMSRKKTNLPYEVQSGGVHRPPLMLLAAHYAFRNHISQTASGAYRPIYLS
jgi:hypothetical protein